MAAKKFDETLKKLEDIVAQLEEGDLGLEESLKLFEEGIKLSRLCTKQLEEAERKVEILLKNEEGEIVPKPFNQEKDS